MGNINDIINTTAFLFVSCLGIVCGRIVRSFFDILLLYIQYKIKESRLYNDVQL